MTIARDSIGPKTNVQTGVDSRNWGLANPFALRHISRSRRGGRVVEGARLESV